MSGALAANEQDYRTSADKTTEKATKIKNQAQQTWTKAQEEERESTRFAKLAQEYLKVANEYKIQLDAAEAKTKTIEELIDKLFKQGQAQDALNELIELLGEQVKA